MNVTAYIPAHNEEATIGACIEALQAQTHPLARIVVVADNCNDSTVEIAKSSGAEVFETFDNRDKKAGGLNQALTGSITTEFVIVVDADSFVNPEFVETAVRVMKNRAIGAVGGIFYGDSGGGILGQFQRNEYLRYAHDIRRRGYRATVLTGTATLFRASALHEVAWSRGGRLAGRLGEIYNTQAITEDNEITIALRTLGYKTVSPENCKVTTEVMMTWADLWNQRLRWQRGALDNIQHYRGRTPVIYSYMGQQIMIALGVLALWLYVLYMGATLGVYGWQPNLFWLGVGAIFLAERVFSVRKAGWKAQMLAFLIIPELVYDLFIQFAWCKALVDMVKNKTPEWG